MKTTTLTLLALLFAGVIHAQSVAPTAAELAWDNIRSTNPTNPETATGATAVRDQIIAGSSMTKRELIIAQRITTANTSSAENEVMVRAIAASSKTGVGAVTARALVKGWDSDMTGWTPEMFAAQPSVAAKLSLANKLLPPEFATSVWSAVQNESAHTPALRVFFKTYRKSLTKAAQIAATQKQKEILLAMPQRDTLANSWLAEISADLIALQLDQ